MCVRVGVAADRLRARADAVGGPVAAPRSRAGCVAVQLDQLRVVHVALERATDGLARSAWPSVVSWTRPRSRLARSLMNACASRGRAGRHVASARASCRRRCNPRPHVAPLALLVSGTFFCFAPTNAQISSHWTRSQAGHASTGPGGRSRRCPCRPGASSPCSSLRRSCGRLRGSSFPRPARRSTWRRFSVVNRFILTIMHDRLGKSRVARGTFTFIVRAGPPNRRPRAGPFDKSPLK